MKNQEKGITQSLRQNHLRKKTETHYASTFAHGVTSHKDLPKLEDELMDMDKQKTNTLTGHKKNSQSYTILDKPGSVHRTENEKEKTQSNVSATKSYFETIKTSTRGNKLETQHIS